MLDRHPDVIRRLAKPVVCCGTRDQHFLLYDIDELENLFRDTPKRQKLTPVDR